MTQNYFFIKIFTLQQPFEDILLYPKYTDI